MSNYTDLKLNSYQTNLILIWAYVFVMLMMAVLGFGSLLNLIFPLASSILGVYLFEKDRTLFLSYFFWTWTLVALFRKISDFNSTYSEPSIILVTPYLVSLVPIFWVIRSAQTKSIKDIFPVLLAIYGSFYGLFIGLIKSHNYLSTVIEFLNLIAPLTISAYIISNWREYPLMLKATKIFFLQALAFTGVYGIYQFLLAPPWDSYWLASFFEDALLLGTPFGTPEPLGIRVWSTMHSPQSFAIFTLAGVLIVLGSNSVAKFPILVVSHVALLLSLARTVWGGWMLAIFIYLAVSKPARQIQLFLLATVTCFILTIIILGSPLYDVVAERIASLSNLQDDGSGGERLTTYQMLIWPALTSYVGLGLGTENDFGRVFDSSVLQTLFSLGWIGTLSYFGGYVITLYKSLLIKSKVKDEESKAFLILALVTIPMLFLAPFINDGPSAALVWLFLGMYYASKKYHFATE